jgi:soluble lytic murein transglycosylase-like protein
MFDVMNRIAEIKKRFGLMRHNAEDGSSPVSFADELKKASGLENGTETTAGFNAAPVDKISLSGISGDQLSRDSINRIADHYSEKNGIPAELTRAVIDAESDYKNDAVSKKGARGLMQLMPSVIKDFGVSDPHNPEENISAGTGLLKNLLNAYSGDYKKALAAYNAGRATVDRHGGVPDYPETKNYIEKIMDKIRGDNGPQTESSPASKEK